MAGSSAGNQFPGGQVIICALCPRGGGAAGSPLAVPPADVGMRGACGLASEVFSFCPFQCRIGGFRPWTACPGSGFLPAWMESAGPLLGLGAVLGVLSRPP